MKPCGNPSVASGQSWRSLPLRPHLYLCSRLTGVMTMWMHILPLLLGCGSKLLDIFASQYPFERHHFYRHPLRNEEHPPLYYSLVTLCVLVSVKLPRLISFIFLRAMFFFFFLCGNWSPKRWTSIFPLHPINTCSHTPPRATPHLQSSVTGLAL